MSSTDTQVTYSERDEVVHLELCIIDHNSADDVEEDVDTDYSEGDKVDADDSDADDGSVSDDDDEEDVDTDYSKGDKVDADDGTLSDVGLLFLLCLQQVAAGLIHDDKRDDKEGDDDVENIYEGLFELFQEHDDDDIDIYDELNALFYESDYMDEVVHRFGKIHEQIMEDHWWYYFGVREVTREMLLERLRIGNIEGIYINSSYRDDEEDLDTDYSKGDKVDADDSYADDSSVSD
nr:hypothetical protein [Tanacetum cinerariifolium]